jgi:hypothetical protein
MRAIRGEQEKRLNAMDRAGSAWSRHAPGKGQFAEQRKRVTRWVGRLRPTLWPDPSNIADIAQHQEAALYPADASARIHYKHRAEIEAVVQGTDRDAAFDTLTAGIGAALASDRTWAASATGSRRKLRVRSICPSRAPRA